MNANGKSMKVSVLAKVKFVSFDVSASSGSEKPNGVDTLHADVTGNGAKRCPPTTNFDPGLNWVKVVLTYTCTLPVYSGFTNTVLVSERPSSDETITTNA